MLCPVSCFPPLLNNHQRFNSFCPPQTNICLKNTHPHLKMISGEPSFPAGGGMAAGVCSIAQVGCQVTFKCPGLGSEIVGNVKGNTWSMSGSDEIVGSEITGQIEWWSGVIAFSHGHTCRPVEGNADSTRPYCSWAYCGEGGYNRPVTTPPPTTLLRFSLTRTLMGCTTRPARRDEAY